MLTAVLALALPGCSKSHKKPAAQPTPSPSPTQAPAKPAEPQANFQPSGIAAVDAQNRPTSNNVASDEAKKVVALVNAYYNIAFLQPSHWGGGAHPDLGTLFSDDARASLGPNLQTVALGNVATQLNRVDPNVQQAGQIRVLIEPNQSPSFAAVTTHFDGTGQAAAAGAAPVHILHDAMFLVDAASNRIIAYQVSTQAESVAKSASYFPPSSEALAALGGA